VPNRFIEQPLPDRLIKEMSRFVEEPVLRWLVEQPGLTWLVEPPLRLIAPPMLARRAEWWPPPGRFAGPPMAAARPASARAIHWLNGADLYEIRPKSPSSRVVPLLEAS